MAVIPEPRDQHRVQRALERRVQGRQSRAPHTGPPLTRGAASPPRGQHEAPRSASRAAANGRHCVTGAPGLVPY